MICIQEYLYWLHCGETHGISNRPPFTAYLKDPRGPGGFKTQPSDCRLMGKMVSSPEGKTSRAFVYDLPP